MPRVATGPFVRRFAPVDAFPSERLHAPCSGSYWQMVMTHRNCTLKRKDRKTVLITVLIIMEWVVATPQEHLSGNEDCVTCYSATTMQPNCSSAKLFGLLKWHASEHTVWTSLLHMIPTPIWKKLVTNPVYSLPCSTQNKTAPAGGLWCLAFSLSTLLNRI